jgi:BirA family biotin operon repressor/biotin-[acetyl-CoA-carboxylase] ligase
VKEEQVAQRLGISTAVFCERVEGLRALGYDIQSIPHLGYQLVRESGNLHADDLIGRLGKTQVIGRDIRVFRETTSTNDIIEKFARDGVKEGIVVFAEKQTRGRGRLGRSWISPAKKGLWFSVLLRPNFRPEQTTQITVASAVAIRRAIEKQTGLRAQIKWPNDVLISGKKVAGILTELRAEMDRIEYVILGIGVNVDIDASEFSEELRSTATSIQAEAGKEISRSALAASILGELDNQYKRICCGQFSKVAAEWEDYCATIGEYVLIENGSRKISGRAEALTEEGALLLRTEHGHIERVTGGTITVVKP